MILRYGTQDIQIDITSIVAEKCTKSSIVYIPPDDNARARLFSDPVFGTVKQIFIGTSSYDDKTAIFIHDNTIYTEDFPDAVRGVYPEECVKATLHTLHKKLVLRYGTMNDELPEQRMAVRFLTNSSKVLEIGGNIGRNSLVIASLIEPSSLVTLESDPKIAAQLEENREVNGLAFHIEPSALSLRPLIQKGWDTFVSEVVLDGYTKVRTITLDELREKYQISFDTLVLDCEGAFFYILQDMPSILDGIHTILMENDYYTLSHKEYLDKVLVERGFTCVYKEALGAEYDYKKFPFKANFFEAWKST
jgi:FkbM family methyltransferase